MKKKLPLIILIIFIFSLTFLSFSQIVKAAPPTITITPQSSDVSTSINYCFGWSSQDDLDAGKNIIFRFASEFDISSLTADEVYFYNGSSDCTTGGRQGEASAVADNDRDLVWPMSGDDQILVQMEDSVSNSTSISVGIVVVSGDTVVTPASAGNYELSMAQYLTGTPNVVDWMENQLLYIGDANDVEISAEVDPTLSMQISSTTCDLGDIVPDEISTCNYYITVSTQSGNGYVSYIHEDTNIQTSGGADDINDAADEGGGSDVDASTTSEEYGVSTTETATADIVRINDANTSSTFDQTDCIYMNDNNVTANATALTTTDKSFALSTGPVSGDITYLCHAATVTGITAAGVYSHTVTITLVATY